MEHFSIVLVSLVAGLLYALSAGRGSIIITMHILISFLFLSLSSTFAFAFDWQGHRGARGLYPENTIGAMKEALKYPITTLELDVVISKDNKVVVSHEPWFNPHICSSIKQNFFELNYSEIKKVDCGSKPHPVFGEQLKVFANKPLLGELLKEVKDSKINFNVEIKSTPEEEKNKFQPDYKTFTALVIKELLSHIPAERFTIQSFDWRVLKFVHENYPHMSVSALSEEIISPEEVIKRLGFTPQIYSPFIKRISATDVAAFHAKKMKVIPWTINTVEEMKAAKAMGVDGIITDYPNLIPLVDPPKCPKNKNYYDDKCVKVPTHAEPSDKNPGWVCKSGYQQKRSRCLKIDRPKNSHFLQDGKTWVCDEGWVKYRDTCKKKH